MEKRQGVHVWLNPMTFFELDTWDGKEEHLPGDARFLDFLCAHDAPHDKATLARRYRDVTRKEPRFGLSAPPAESGILSKLVFPLHQAKASYVAGDFLGCIALCGLVAEMITILAYEVYAPGVLGRPLREDEQRAAWNNRTFEELYQSQRIRALSEQNMIGSVEKEALELIAEKRKWYLHYFSKSHDKLSGDALLCYERAFKLAVAVLGQDLRDGRFAFRPEMIEYLRRTG